MPRKKLIYTHELPYHVYARSNNKEWFYIPKNKTWEIFSNEIQNMCLNFNALIHAFVLMDNHYHMLITTDQKHPLSVVMENLQKSVSRKINKLANRQNHIFGGPYKGSLITNNVYYAQVIKYVYRNPVEAGLSKLCEEYPYSTLAQDQVAICSPLGGIASSVPTAETLSTWINHPENTNSLGVKKGLKKTIYSPAMRRY